MKCIHFLKVQRFVFIVAAPKNVWSCAASGRHFSPGVYVQKLALGTKGSDLYAALWLETPSSLVILAASPLLERLTQIKHHPHRVWFPAPSSLKPPPPLVFPTSVNSHPFPRPETWSSSLSPPPAHPTSLLYLPASLFYLLSVPWVCYLFIPMTTTFIQVSTWILAALGINLPTHLSTFWLCTHKPTSTL